jgi:hypothetical protein
MKKLIGIIAVLCCFMGHVRAQQLEVVSATKHFRDHITVGGKAPRRGEPYTSSHCVTTSVCIILSCKDFNYLALDSVYIDYMKSGLVLNKNLYIDSLQHTYTINLNSFGRSGSPPVIHDHILYEYKGVKHTLPIKNIEVSSSKSTTFNC